MNRWTRYVTSAVAAVALLGAGLGLIGCDVLDVNNPNTVIEEDLSTPSSAPAMANGAEASVTRAVSALSGPYGTATDELTWIGSRDAWNELDRGTVSNELNEFSDQAFPYVGEARWLTDEFISKMEGFKEDGTLENPSNLARTYLYGAIIYTTIANVFDNFTFSDRQEAGEPVGPSNMAGLYDTALNYINSGLKLAGNGTQLKATLLAMRARVKFDKGIWQKVNPTGDVSTGSPLVNGAQMTGPNSDSSAADDARAALEMVNDGFSYELEQAPSRPGVLAGVVNASVQVNSRQELRIGDTYIYGKSSTSTPDSVAFKDPVDGVIHPFVKRTVNRFTDAGQYADVTIVSQREMFLILAETELAQGDLAGFTTQINRLRALEEKLSDYQEGEAVEGESGRAGAVNLLVDARQANLLLQQRRLADHYRFQDPSPEWGSGQDEAGTFFPITITEIRSNPNLSQ